MKYRLPEKKKSIRIFGTKNLIAKRYLPQEAKEKIVIVLPTYNERENIATLVPEIEAVFQSNQINGSLLFVDDNSKDGTGIEAKNLARRYKNIMVISRPGKMGLGSAYRVGFEHCHQAWVRCYLHDGFRSEPSPRLHSQVLARDEKNRSGFHHRVPLLRRWWNRWLVT